MKTILWEYRLQMAGFIDAEPDIVSARNALIRDIAANPQRYITGLRPCEPTPNTFIELGKRVIGLK